MLEEFIQSTTTMKIVYMTYIMWGTWLVLDGVNKIVLAIKGTPEDSKYRRNTLEDKEKSKDGNN